MYKLIRYVYHLPYTHVRVNAPNFNRQFLLEIRTAICPPSEYHQYVTQVFDQLSRQLMGLYWRRYLSTRDMFSKSEDRRNTSAYILRRLWPNLWRLMFLCLLEHTGRTKNTSDLGLLAKSLMIQANMYLSSPQLLASSDDQNIICERLLSLDIIATLLTRYRCLRQR